MRKRKNLETKDLHFISRIGRKKFHPGLHKISREKCISPGCLFYMKEYGAGSHVVKTIVKESIMVLLLASIISSVAGIGLEGIRSHIANIIPIIILLPILNDAVGDFGTIIGSRFTEMIYTGEVKRNWWRSAKLRELLKFLYIVGFVMSIYISVLTFIASVFVGASLTLSLMLKLMLVSVVTSMILIGALFLVSVYIGTKIYHRKEDPNNFLIPITTAVADFFTIMIYAGLVFVIF